jgi:hypothetical protein
MQVLPCLTNLGSLLSFISMIEFYSDDCEWDLDLAFLLRGCLTSAEC